MPELPEVETVRRTLKNFVLNKKIISIDVLLKMMLRNLLKPVQIRLLMILIGLENF